MTAVRLLPLAALLLTGGCAYDSYAEGYAPDNYPPGYDSGMGGGQYVQPGDMFGGQNVVSIEVFFEPLAPYGQWVDSRFGRAFLPHVQQGWRPYVNGRWGENRLWISDDPWGWATDHYGRWGFDDRIGWVWVPGTEWAPSWVAWREADEVVGWAPIPPGVSYSFSVGFGGGWGYDDWNSWYGPSWIWVPSPYLYQRGFGGRVLPWNTGANYWRGSRWNWNNGWDGRPGYNRPGGWGGNYGGGRPGGWGGYEGGGRPGGNYGRPQPRPGVSDQIGGGIAGVPPRPGGNWQGQPGTRRGTGNNWQGQPGTRPGGNWQGQPGTRPDGSTWQGRPGNPRPGGLNGGAPAGNWQGRPPGGSYGGRPPGVGQGGVGGAIGGSMAPPRGMAGGNPPPVMRSPPPQAMQPAPQPRMAQPAPPPRADPTRGDPTRGVPRSERSRGYSDSNERPQ